MIINITVSYLDPTYRMRNGEWNNRELNPKMINSDIRLYKSNAPAYPFKWRLQKDLNPRYSHK